MHKWRARPGRTEERALQATAPVRSGNDTGTAPSVTSRGKDNPAMTVETPVPPAESNEDAPASPPRPETNPTRLRILQGRYTGPTDIEGQLRLSAALARAKRAIPWQYRDNPGDILAVIQQAVALDIQVATALDNLVFSDTGVGGMRAKLMQALLTRAGHEVIVTHHDARICRMLLKRGDGRRGGGAQWTLAEAQRAGLLTKERSPWHAYGEDMLWARCVSRLARRYAAEVIAGFYVAEELDDLPDDDHLDPADTSVMTDLDGNPVVAPDVEAFLEDLDTRDLEQLRDKWKQAGQEGLMGAYAGTVDAVALSVRDLLFARLADAEEAEKRRQAAGGAVPDVNAIATAATPPAPAVEPEPTDGDDALAGVGRMQCGCESAAVLSADGRHQDGCTRPARRSGR